jgi:PPK2 family polyphosphate:nucleotide phosphotransferase
MKPLLFQPVASPYLVPYDGSFRIGAARTSPPPGAPDKKDNIKALEEAVAQFAKLQHKLYADDRYSLLLVFQAMDAAGKDGTIRSVLSGVNPQGCQTYSFKAPSSEVLDHDFLWRIQRALPERGRIGVFNRSHYEETLVVRVNPGYLAGQRLPRRPTTLPELWEERHESIRDAEKHWARNGTVVLKFFLNVSRAEQHQRFLERLEDPDDHWKFNAGDLRESDKWDSYMEAYEAALNETSRPWAPWYAIPADSKSYMRRTVADIIVGTLAGLDLRYPEPSSEERDELARIRAQLQAATGGTDGKDGKDGKNGKNGKK